MPDTERSVPTADQDVPDPQFDATTSRLLRREALRRAAEELNTTSGPGLEDALARISAEVTEEAACRHAAAAGKADHAEAALSDRQDRIQLGQPPSIPVGASLPEDQP